MPLHPTTTTTRRLVSAASVLAALALPLAACGDTEERAAGADPSAASAPSTPPAQAAPAAPDRLELTALDFEWEGLPERLAAGSYPVTLRNRGSELHEISVFQNTDGLSLEELHGLGPVGITERVEMAGTFLAGVGETAEGVLELEPGTYEVVCFVPAAVDGQPHFAHGMHRTLEVL